VLNPKKDTGLLDTPERSTVTVSGTHPSGRRLSGIDRFWLVADRQHPPFVNQMVLEGEGYPVPPQPWSKIMTSIAEAQPSLRARLHGRLTRCRWEADGPLAPVRELEAPGWLGHGPEGAPFLRDSLNPSTGPTCEVLVVKGSLTRVIIRTHHALMDGQGTLLMARGFFAALRGEEPPRAELGPMNDAILMRSLGVPPQRMLPTDSVAPQGPPDGAEMRVTWVRRRVEGRFSALLPRIAIALARWHPLPEGRTFRITVPVDLRRYAPGLSSSGNLTGLVRLEVAEHLRAPDPLQSLTRALTEGIERRDAGGSSVAAEFARFLPISFMGRVARWGSQQALRKATFGPAATLSNLGKLAMEDFSGAGFSARRCFFVPPGNPSLPVFLAITGDSTGVELCATVPVSLATHGRDVELCDVMERALKEP
jgi:hypothetical protein